MSLLLTLNLFTPIYVFLLLTWNMWILRNTFSFESRLSGRATELFWKEDVLIFPEICVKIISRRNLIFNKILGCKIFNFLLYLGIDQGFWNSCLWLLFLFTLDSQNLLVFYWWKSHQRIFCKQCSNCSNNWNIKFLKIDFLKNR